MALNLLKLKITYYFNICVGHGKRRGGVWSEGWQGKGGQTEYAGKRRHFESAFTW